MAWMNSLGKFWVDNMQKLCSSNIYKRNFKYRHTCMVLCSVGDVNIFERVL